MNPPCPACDSSTRPLPYSVRGVPAHSVLLMESRDEALGYPTGDIELILCDACGFVFNAAFDPALNDYSPAYEETQHFSSHFNDFAQRLAQRWVDDFQLKNRTLVEIGCGKGEFLALMCRLGNNRGIGIDPGCRPERLSTEDRQRLTLLRELYADRHRDLQADAILCRHTLEHIAPVEQFLRQLQRSVIDPEMLLLFELPDTTIVFEECRFWDIYYEHCSYFTAESLVALFRRCGFDVLEVRREFDDQYLTLAARVQDDRDRTGQTVRDTRPHNIHTQARDFASRVKTEIDCWRRQLNEWNRRGQSVAIWGGGSKCVSFLTTLRDRGQPDDLACLSQIVDINPHKQGRYLPGTGHKVGSPESLDDAPPDIVLVMNPTYRDEVRQCLSERNIAAQLITTQRPPAAAEVA